MRWTSGNIQTAARLKFRLFGQGAKHCTYRQRLAGFVFGASAVVNGSVQIIAFLGIPLVLLSGYSLVVYSTAFDLKWLLRLVSMFIFADYINKVSMSLFVGYIEAMRWDSIDQWLVPYLFTTFVRDFLLPWRKPKFKPTGKVQKQQPIDEREPGTTFWQMIKYLYFPYHVWIHTLFIHFCLVGAALTVLRAFLPELTIYSAYGFIPPLTSHERWMFILVRVLWPPLFWLQSCASCCIPIRYVVAPPKKVKREDVMLRDAAGVWRVRDDAWKAGRKKCFGRFGGLGEHVSTAIFVWSIACFWWGWYIDRE